MKRMSEGKLRGFRLVAEEGLAISPMAGELVREIEASWQEIKKLKAENELILSTSKEFIRGLGREQAEKDMEIESLRQALEEE